MEFLVNIRIQWPSGIAEPEKTRIIAAERARAAELAALGHLVRIWRVPGQMANWGIWKARDATELHEIISSLPAYPWMTGVEVIALARHPSDPAAPDRSGT